MPDMGDRKGQERGRRGKGREGSEEKEMHVFTLLWVLQLQCILGIGIDYNTQRRVCRQRISITLSVAVCQNVTRSSATAEKQRVSCAYMRS